MTKKRILNLTSQKKYDTMAPNISYPASSAAIGILPVPPAVNTWILWSPTGRDMREIQPDDKVGVPSGRNATTCFVRGVKEKWTVLTQNGSPWRWRRIVFTAKGQLPLGEEFEGDRSISVITDTEGRQTYYRNMAPLPTGSLGPLADVLFRGTNDRTGAFGFQDWNDVMTAPVDTTRFKVLENKVRHIRCGNDAGVAKNISTWTPVNKNIVYGDEEVGGQVTTSAKSTIGRPGIGDIYFLDILSPQEGSGGENMGLSCTSTVYWHEK